MARPADDHDRHVVTGIILDLQLRGRKKIGAVRRLGQTGPGTTDIDRVLHDVTMAVRCIQHPLPPRSHTEKEERSRPASHARRRRRVVVDRVGDEPEHEPGLMATQVEQGLLAVGMGGRRFAVHADQSEFRRPVDEVTLDRGEDVPPTCRGQRQRLAGVTDDIVRTIERETRVTQQLAVGRLRDRRDQEAGRDPPSHLVCVVRPKHGVGLAVDGPDRIAQARRLRRSEHAYLHVVDPDGIRCARCAGRCHGRIVSMPPGQRRIPRSPTRSAPAASALAPDVVVRRGPSFCVSRLPGPVEVNPAHKVHGDTSSPSRRTRHDCDAHHGRQQGTRVRDRPSAPR